MKPQGTGGKLGAAVWTLAVLLSVWGCATVELRGTSGPVSWEVTDIGQVTSLDGMRMRWSYVVVLKETAGVAIQFDRVERGSYAPNIVGGAPTSVSFHRSLAANSELRAAFSDSWGWVGESVERRRFGGAALLGSLTVERRFIGTDAQGRAVTVLVRLQLDRSLGKRSTRPPTIGTLPPDKRLEASDLARLAGDWRGSYRARIGNEDFDIPIEWTVRADGSVEFGEHDPVTNRFRGTLSIRDGRLAYASRGNDSGTVTFHEGGGRRVLFGTVSGPREGGWTFSYTIRLEATGP